MEADQLILQEYWIVLQKIHKLYFFNYSLSSVIVYGYVAEVEKGVLFRLQVEGAIKLINLTRFSTPGVISIDRPPEEIKIEVFKENFIKIYEEIRDELSSEKDLKSQNDSSSSKGASKELINNLIKVKKIRGKEKRFIQALANLKPKSLKELTAHTETKDIKSLNRAVKKKLENSQWSIKTTRGTGWGKESFYQLIFLSE